MSACSAGVPALLYIAASLVLRLSNIVLSAAVITPALDVVAAAIESLLPVEELIATVVVPSTTVMLVSTFTSAPVAIPSNLVLSDALITPERVVVAASIVMSVPFSIAMSTSPALCVIVKLFVSASKESISCSSSSRASLTLVAVKELVELS